VWAGGLAAANRLQNRNIRAAHSPISVRANAAPKPITPLVTPGFPLAAILVAGRVEKRPFLVNPTLNQLIAENLRGLLARGHDKSPGIRIFGGTPGTAGGLIDWENAVGRVVMASHVRAILCCWPVAPTVFAMLLASIGNPMWAANSTNDSLSSDSAALFDRLDTNHDGKLEASEIATDNRALFDQLVRRGDSDHDQVLSRDEFLKALAPTRPEKPIEVKESTTIPGANAVRYLLLTMDTNRNGRIEKDEVPKDLKPVFDQMVERLDKDGDGAIERKELSRGGPGMGALAQRYCRRKGIDVDAELENLKKWQGEKFDRFDERPMPLADVKDPKQARRLFATLDENGDGKLEPSEVPEPLREPIERLVRIADRDRDGKLSEAEFMTATEQLSRFMKRRQGDEMPSRKEKKDRKESAKSSSTAKNN
jgi:Ca2+-binding EF-hand superfamily protein